MFDLLIVVSGPVQAGKTTLARSLNSRLNSHLYRTRDELLQNYHSPQAKTRRERLQALGDQLDSETGGAWVAHGLARQASRLLWTRVIIVDAVRRESQIDHLRAAFPTVRLLHVHLTASLETLAVRYESRERPSEEEPETYAEVRANTTEASIHQLGVNATLRLTTDVLPPQDAILLVMRAVWWYRSTALLGMILTYAVRGVLWIAFPIAGLLAVATALLELGPTGAAIGLAAAFVYFLVLAGAATHLSTAPPPPRGSSASPPLHRA